jgi:hypothetical protein
MSARNGQRARFHRNRKRRVVRAMHLREVMAELKQKKTETPAAPSPAAPPRTKRGPALSGS